MSVVNLAFVQPYVPEYRVPFFRRLQEQLSDHHVVLDVIVSRRQSARGDGAVSFPQIVAKDRLADVTGDRLRWRSGVASGSGYELVIVEHALRNLDSLPLLARPLVRGPGVALWGHGHTHSRARRRRDAAKAFLARRGEWFFVYTESGATSLRSIGVPGSRITVIGNTIDTADLAADLAAVNSADREAFEREHGLTAGHTALFIGGLDHHKGAENLVPLAREAQRRDPRFTLLIAGDGPLLVQLAAEEARGAPVRVLGRSVGARKALAMSSSALIVIPKGIGLVAVEALTASLPIVSSEGAAHGPEEDYLQEGRHAVRIVSREPADLARCVTDLLARPDLLAVMREDCRQAGQGHSIEHMVTRTVDGILAWRDIHEHGLGH